MPIYSKSGNFYSPGTPATEILESIAEVAKNFGIYAEWSINEIVALEVAAGASMAGVRAIVSMKHVGLNVAADAASGMRMLMAASAATFKPTCFI